MKRAILILMILSLIIVPVNVIASPPEFSGGVNNEYEYEEVVFLTGEPVKFIGTVSITEKDKTDSKTISYSFKLVPEDKSIKGKLDRRISYTIAYDTRSDKGQTIGQMSVSSYRETIDVDEDRFELKDYQFSKSDVIDNRPASDFSSGNIKGRKVYTINKTEGEAIVDVSGGSVGYENFWGATETQIIDFVFEVERQTAEDRRPTSWQGTVRSQVSDSMTKELRYSDNEANLSSFNGGYIRTTNSEIVSKYEYDLPLIDRNGINNKRRDRGTISLSKQKVPKIERLIVPKFRDLGGHWAESHINKLYSLDVFDEVSTFFVPDVPMTREEFTRAVIRASDIRPTEEPKKRTSSRRKDPEVSPFVDVAVGDINYEYIKNGVAKGIIQGVSENKFAPKDSLTRAQAITIIIRVLGFESKAPTPGYYTSFSDDRLIPAWAKDSIYMAKEIGLVQGDQLNRVNPNQVLTRAEASAMLVRFLEFLEKDLQQDYRENIILFN